MNLREIILQEEREKWADQKGFPSWDDFYTKCNSVNFQRAMIGTMEKSYSRIDVVFRWAAFQEFVLNAAEKHWYQNENPTILFSDLELYQLYKETNL